MTRECNLGCKDVVNLFTQNTAYSSKANGHEYVCQLNMRQTEAGLKTDSTRQKTHKPGPRQASGASHPPQRPGGMERNWRKEKGEKKLKGSPPPNQARD